MPPPSALAAKLSGHTVAAILRLILLQGGIQYNTAGATVSELGYFLYSRRIYYSTCTLPSRVCSGRNAVFVDCLLQSFGDKSYPSALWPWETPFSGDKCNLTH